ncbi:alpha/beta fold hydrolase [Aestuariivirga sp.]|uniref:alpha/beta fold hydrolase n=1 Tax=Aestuariivirga sp. TaxID=2650926 RepID=UPI00391ADB4B
MSRLADRLGRRGRFAAAGALAGIAAACGAAIAVERQAAEAERDNPPTGAFLMIDGVRLHYIDTGGPGRPVVMYHGNGAMIADLEISGIVERIARHHRTIVFDRPGYGYSSRPRGQAWDPAAQAQLFQAALTRLGVERPLVFGHSWGSLVALAQALDYPEGVAGLVLVSGYYFPQARADMAALSPPVLPVLGGIVRHTVAPFAMRRMAPRAIARMFSPAPVTDAFRERFPLELALRPSQIRASSEELALLNDAAESLSRHYGEITLPAAIVAGEADAIVETSLHAVRLHAQIPGSTLHLLPGSGHMLHHTETDALARIVEDAAASLASREAAPPA